MDIRIKLPSKSRDENVLLLAVISCFLPFVLSMLACAAVTAYILLGKERRAGCLKGLANIIMYVFVGLTAFVGYIYDNYIGILCSCFFFCAIIIMNFAATVASKQFFIRLLQTVTRMGVVLSFATFTEKAVLALLDTSYRCSAYCANPNYLAELLVVSVLSCAYLEITRSSRAVYCYPVAIINCIAIFLTGSMFAWIALLVGIAMLLLLTRHHIILSVMIIIFIAAMLTVMSQPDIFPRLNEASATTINRFKIWQFAIEHVKDHPLFGQGFLSYRMVSRDVLGAYTGWHCHNIIIESLLSFGIIGTSLAVMYFWLIFRRLGKAHEALADKQAASCFVISLLAAVLVHSMVDLTFMWTQTALLGAIIIGSELGADLKVIKKQHGELFEPLS